MIVADGAESKRQRGPDFLSQILQRYQWQKLVLTLAIMANCCLTLRVMLHWMSQDVALAGIAKMAAIWLLFFD
jgi:hypothetical protein